MVEIKSLRSIAEVANKVSKERAPANKLMSSNAADFLKIKNLKEYRLSVDRQLNETIHILKEEGYADLANTLDTKFRDDLKQARAVVDYYVATPEQARSSIQFDNAILAMFGAWDSCREVLQNLMLQLKSKDSQINNYFTLIVVLTDMRDQAGRTASNVIAPVTFKETIPNDNRARSLQTQQQARYLWALVDTLQSEQAKTPEYHRLYSRVKTEFLDKGVPIVGQLLDESQKHQAYHLNGTELTDQIVDKFTTVIDLQKFLLNKSVLIASQENYLAKRSFSLLCSFQAYP